MSIAGRPAGDGEGGPGGDGGDGGNGGGAAAGVAAAQSIVSASIRCVPMRAKRLIPPAVQGGEFLQTHSHSDNVSAELKQHPTTIDIGWNLDYRFSQPGSSVLSIGSDAGTATRRRHSRAGAGIQGLELPSVFRLHSEFPGLCWVGCLAGEHAHKVYPHSTFQAKYNHADA